MTLLPGVDNSNTGVPISVLASSIAQTSRAQRRFPIGDLIAGSIPVLFDAGLRHVRKCRRNIMEGPGFATINVSAIKNTLLREGITLQFRAEIYNLLDRANFGLPDGFFGSPSFGHLLLAGEPRRAQLKLQILILTAANLRCPALTLDEGRDG